MIRLLDDATIGQIAAGEVIERPVSVVKELVENALDAGSGSISVFLARGGLDRIDVRDDGDGIARDDLALAVRRHATSKLHDAAALGDVRTLGFRGEGLASIAAVANVRVTSRTGDEDVGYAVEAHGEWIGEPQPVAAARGTRVEVSDLFCNVPVRREFLRAVAAEFARISAFLSTIALAYPHVRFSLAHEGRDVWTFPPAQSIEARLAHVFGYAAAEELLVLSESPVASGFISRPGSERTDRRMQLVFVNGRLLRSTLFSGAWTGGYATFALSGRHPYGVLFVTLAPGRVDPNVHPTKSDVRLRDGAAVTDAVRHAIAATLREHAAQRLASAVSFAPQARDGAAPSTSSTEELPLATNGQAPNAAVHPSLHAVDDTRILAQLDDTFILATDGRALLLVDQHAAHERVAYEALCRRYRDDGPTEPLLVPYTIELDAARHAAFEGARSALLEAGFDVEPFGERAYRVRATPAGYGARAFDPRGFVDDIGEPIAGLSARERVWASLACHSVVRAGERLEPEEMLALIRRLRACENPMHCPHGRPTLVRVEADTIARMFKRT